MNKLAVLMVFALLACVAYVRATPSSADGGLDALVSHYKCYQARHAKLSPRFQHETVFLTDQFRHNVETSVVKLSTFCSRATQEPAGTGSVASLPVNLTCYTVRDAPRQQRFQSTNVRVSDKLTAGFQTLTLSKVQAFCAPAVKSPITTSLEGHGFVCYQAKRAKGQPRFQQTDRRIDDQFDGKNVRILRPIAFCTQSEKKVEAPNDNIADASDIAKDLLKEGDPLDIHLSTVHATLEPSDPPISCKTPGYSNSVWFHWSAPENKSLILDTSGSSYDTVLAAFEDNDPSEAVDLKEVGCNDDVDSCAQLDGTQGAGCHLLPSARLQFDAWASTDYYILVGSSDGHGGKVKLRVQAKLNGNNDSCSSPRLISGLNYQDHISTMDASRPTSSGAAAGDPINCNQADPISFCSTSNFGASVWYTYTPSSHQEVDFDTYGSSYETAIAVYQASNGTLVGCASSEVTVVLKNPNKYLIMIASADVANNYRGGKLKFHATLVHKLDFDGQDAGVQAAAIPYDSMTCYQVRQARHSTETEQVEDQFSVRQVPSKGPGFWTLTVGGVDSFCVPSSKDPCGAGSEDALQPAAPVAIDC